MLELSEGSIAPRTTLVRRGRLMEKKGSRRKTRRAAPDAPRG